jgi:hypothetical protein
MKNYLAAVLMMFLCVWVVTGCNCGNPNCSIHGNKQKNHREQKAKQYNIYQLLPDGEMKLKWSDVDFQNADGTYIRFRTKDGDMVRTTIPYVCIEE